jgi:Rod binding domain-containing protein
MAAMMAAAGPDPARVATPEGARAWKAAQDFEAMALGALLAPIFATLDPSGGPFGGGEAEKTWRPMLVEAIGKRMAQAGGLGLAVPVFNQMLRMQEGGRE